MPSKCWRFAGEGARATRKPDHSRLNNPNGMAEVLWLQKYVLPQSLDAFMPAIRKFCSARLSLCFHRGKLPAPRWDAWFRTPATCIPDRLRAQFLRGLHCRDR